MIVKMAKDLLDVDFLKLCPVKDDSFRKYVVWKNYGPFAKYVNGRMLGYVSLLIFPMKNMFFH